MVREGKGRLFRRRDGKYLIYLPVNFGEDSMFPFKNLQRSERGQPYSIDVKMSFQIGGNKLIIEKWKDPQKQ